jgi:diguanylate cyclase (GGDEF)-like protein
MCASDVVGRIGGDEIAIFLPESDRAAAEVVFKKIHREPMAHATVRQWPIDFSAGAAIFNPAPPSVDTALGMADQTMFEVKKSGKNNVVYKEYHTQQRAPAVPDE